MKLYAFLVGCINNRGEGFWVNSNIAQTVNKGLTGMKSMVDELSKCILIVDNDEMIRTTVREFLKRIVDGVGVTI